MPKLEDYVGGVSLKTWFFIVAIGILIYSLSQISEEVTQTHFFIGVILLIGIVVTQVSSETKKTDFAQIEEARDIIKHYLDTHKDIRLPTGEIIDIGKYSIDPDFILREERVGKERIPYKYVLQIIITDSEEMEHYIKGYVHPVGRYVMGFLGIEKPLEDKDQCSKCGREFDVEFVDTEDLRKLKDTKKKWEE